MNPDQLLPQHVLEIKDANQLQEPVFYSRLCDYINQLIVENFNELIRLLYRIDVSEPKLKLLLQEHPKEDAGKIIAILIIERQLEKIKSRQQFKQPKTDFDEEEKW